VCFVVIPLLVFFALCGGLLLALSVREGTMSIYSTLNHLVALGAKDGKERGCRAGACRQLGKLLLRHGKRALGTPSPEQRALMDQLMEQWNLEQLEQVRDRLPDAASWSALLADIQVLARPADPDYLLPFEFDPEPMPPSIDEYARVKKVPGGEVIFHIRFQRLYQENLGAILYRESQQKQAEHHCPVETVVLLLWPGADGPAMTGEYAIPKGGTYRYHLTRLWERDAEEMLNNPSTLAFAPLGKFKPERLGEIIRRMDEAIEARSEEDKHNLWIVVYSGMGLRFSAEQVHELLAHRMPYLLQTQECRSTMSGGYYDAFTEGEAEGALQAARVWVLTLGRQRLGEPEPAVGKAIETRDSLDQLEQLAARVLKGTTWREVLAPN
jgi:hypothetical protein